MLTEYSDYANVFSYDLSIEFPKYTGINNYAIDLVEQKQPPFSLIGSISLLK